MQIDYCINPKIFKKEEVLKRLSNIKNILEKEEVYLAYLFGSIKKDSVSKSSDLDIALLVPEKDYNFFEIYNKFYEIFCRTFKGDNIDIVILNSAPLSLKYHILKEGINFYFSDEVVKIEFEEKSIKEYEDTIFHQKEQWDILCKRMEGRMNDRGYRINKSKIMRLMLKFEESITRLKKFSSISQKEFLKNDNWEARSLVEHNLRIAIECALDMGRHIIVAKGMGVPEEIRDIGRILGEKKIISEELAVKLKAMAGLRNILVHLYWDIDYKKLHHIITKELSDLIEYAKAITKYMKSQS